MTPPPSQDRVARVVGDAVQYLKPNTQVEVDLTPSLLESPEQTVRDFQDAQSRLEFPLNEGERCRRCSFYRDICPAV